MAFDFNTLDISAQEQEERQNNITDTIMTE